jgi:hypothetical protein
VVGELVDRDQEHLRLLKLGFCLMAGMAGFFSLLAVFYIALGVIFALGAVHANSTGDPRLFGLIFVCIGGALFVIGLVAASLIYYAGRSIAERRRRAFCVVIACLSCLQIPWGTAIGVCAILVLNRPSVIALFMEPIPAAPPPGGGSAD